MSGQGEVLRFDPGEFERRHKGYEKFLEIVLHISLTSEAAHAAEFIAEALNKELGIRALELKAAEAVSKKDTKFTYQVTEYEFQAAQKERFTTRFRAMLDEYFRKRPGRCDEQRPDAEDPWRAMNGVPSPNGAGGVEKRKGPYATLREDIEKIVEFIFNPEKA